MSYSVSRLSGCFLECLLAGYLSLIPETAAVVQGPWVWLKLGTVSKEKKVCICGILKRLNWQNLEISKKKIMEEKKKRKYECRPLVFKLFCMTKPSTSYWETYINIQFSLQLLSSQMLWPEVKFVVEVYTSWGMAWMVY